MFKLGKRQSTKSAVQEVKDGVLDVAYVVHDRNEVLVGSTFKVNLMYAAENLLPITFLMHKGEMTYAQKGDITIFCCNESIYKAVRCYIEDRVILTSGKLALEQTEGEEQDAFDLSLEDLQREIVSFFADPNQWYGMSIHINANNDERRSLLFKKPKYEILPLSEKGIKVEDIEARLEKLSQAEDIEATLNEVEVSTADSLDEVDE